MDENDKKNVRKQFGNLPPKYNFSLNPYPELRLSRCPDCQNKTGQRKLPLLIYVAPKNLIALNYTNRYCKHCDMLIGHKHEIEHHLTEMFLNNNPEIIEMLHTMNSKLSEATLKTPGDGPVDPKTVDEKIKAVTDNPAYSDRLHVDHHKTMAEFKNLLAQKHNVAG